MDFVPIERYRDFAILDSTTSTFTPFWPPRSVVFVSRSAQRETNRAKGTWGHPSPERGLLWSWPHSLQWSAHPARRSRPLHTAENSPGLVCLHPLLATHCFSAKFYNGFCMSRFLGQFLTTLLLLPLSDLPQHPVCFPCWSFFSYSIPVVSRISLATLLQAPVSFFHLRG